MAELPDSLQTFFKVVLGFEWPEGSVERMRELADVWIDQAAVPLERAADAAGAAASGLEDALDGDTAEVLVPFIRQQLQGYLAEAADNARQVSKSVKNAAADIEKQEIQFIVFATITLIEVAIALYFIFTSF